MEINGREIKFKRTIWATLAVGAMCPGKDLQQLDAVLRENFVDGNMASAQFCCIMSEGYERSRAFEASQKGENYEPNPLTMDEIMNLEDMEVFQQLFIEAADAWKKDGKQTVEAEPPKGKKKDRAHDKA